MFRQSLRLQKMELLDIAEQRDSSEGSETHDCNNPRPSRGPSPPDGALEALGREQVDLRKLSQELKSSGVRERAGTFAGGNRSRRKVIIVED
jgi:hypothetical protein